MFKSWLAEHGHEHDVEVEEFAQSVGQLLKKQHNADHRANLFMLWSTYLSMVEEDGDTYAEITEKPLVSLVTNIVGTVKTRKC